MNIRDLLASYNSGILRARQAYAAENDHGTLAGYKRHTNDEDTACDPCRDAYTAWRRSRYAYKKAAG